MYDTTVQTAPPLIMPSSCLCGQKPTRSMAERVTLADKVQTV